MTTSRPSGPERDRTEPPPAVLEGVRILLRPALPEDIEARLRSGRDRELARGYGIEWVELPYTREAATSWYERTRRRGGWVITVNDEAIGDCHLDRDPVRDRCGRFSIGVWSAAHRSRGYGTEATQLVVDHGFRDLGLHRIELRVLERNQVAVRCYVNSGFVNEGLERETAFLDGAWQNDLIMSILRQEWSARS